MILNSPLDQFLVIGLYIWYSNAHVFLFFIGIIISFFLFFIYDLSYIHGLSLIFVNLFVFFWNSIFKLIYTINGFANLFFIWFFVLCVSLTLFNVSGLVPFSFTLTTHLLVSLSIAFLFFFWINLIFFLRFWLEFISLFLPAGTPLFIMFLIIPIEILSYISRLLSLSIRLFANMMSGHTLLIILISFLFLNLTFNWLLTMPFIILHIIYFLETCVAFLQVYVFLVLTYLYLLDTYRYDAH